MAKAKDNTNWWFITIGCCLCLAFLWTGQQTVQQNELDTLTIVLNQDIQKSGGRRSLYQFRLNTEDYACTFVIKNAGGMAAQWDNLDNTLAGDTLIIGIHNSRLKDLTNKVKTIPIYTLIKNNQQVYTLNNYNASQKMINRRWNTIFTFAGILFLLLGFGLLSRNVTAFVAAVGFLVITTLRILDVWW